MTEDKLIFCLAKSEINDWLNKVRLSYDQLYSSKQWNFA